MNSPTYRAKLPSGFETKAEANQRRRNLVRILKKGNRAERRLAKKLRHCREGVRCQSAACPVCIGAFRVDLLREGEFVLEGFNEWVRASIIPAGFSLPFGNLDELDLLAMARAVRKRLERHFHDVRVVIAGIDISLNTINNEAQIWQPHLYLLMQSKASDHLRGRLKIVFPGEPTAHRPHVVTALYSFRKPLTYVFKSEFSRRSNYLAHGKRQVATQPLKNSELRELTVALDRFPLGARLILKGVRRTSGNPMRLLL